MSGGARGIFSGLLPAGLRLCWRMQSRKLQGSLVVRGCKWSLDGNFLAVGLYTYGITLVGVWELRRMRAVVKEAY